MEMHTTWDWASVFVNATEEVTNYSRLLSLLVEEGTPRLQHYMLTHLPHETVTLEDAIKLNESRLRALQKHNVLNKGQAAILFPTFDGPLDMNAIDLSLWYILITNLSTGLTRRQWSRLEHKPALSRDLSPENDIIRLRNLRNTICHLSPPQIDNDTYTQQWRELCEVLIRLGTEEQALHVYAQRIPDHKQTLNHILRMKEEVHSDVEAAYQGELARRKHMMWGLGVVALLVCVAAFGVCAAVYVYSRTWSSCIHKITFKITSEYTYKMYGADYLSDLQFRK